MLIHGFSPVNARLLITCDTAFYAIIGCNVILIYSQLREDKLEHEKVEILIL